MSFMRLFALFALIMPQDDPARHARELVEKLRSEKVEEREEAAKGLLQLGKIAVPELNNASADRDTEVAARARFVLKTIGLSERLSSNIRREFPAVESRLASGDAHGWTVLFLGALELWTSKREASGLELTDLDSIAREALTGASSSDERWEVCQAVLYFGLRSAAPECVDLLKDKDVNVRIDAGHALVALGTNEQVPKLVSLLKDKDWDTRRRAMDLLGRMRAAEAMPEILSYLREKDGFFNWRVIDALGNLGTKDAQTEVLRILEALETARRNGNGLVYDPFVTGKALAALGRLGARDEIPRIAGWLDERDSTLRADAIHALWHLGARGEIPRIARLLEDPKVRRDAVMALIALGAKECIPDLAKYLEDRDRDVRLGVLQALAILQGKEAVYSLAKGLADVDPHVRRAAAKWLCHIGSWEGMPLLLEEGTNLFPMNALRRPEVWRRLRTKRLEGQFISLEFLVIERLALDAGLALEAPKGALGNYRRGCGYRGTLVEEFEGVLPFGNGEAILETDRIRILPRDEALKFWRDWWKAEQEKK